MPSVMESTRFRSTTRYTTRCGIKLRRSSRHRLWVLWLVVAVNTMVLVVAYWMAIARLHRSPQGDPVDVVPQENPAGTEGDVPGKRHDGPDPLPDVGETQGFTSTSYVVTQDLPSAVSDLVARYEAGQPCLLRRAGYLDLFGEVWGCLVQGPGWVDLCVVQQGEEEEKSEVQVIRMVATKDLLDAGLNGGVSNEGAADGVASVEEAPDV